MFKRLAVISIPVKDQQAAKAFYTNVLGCQVTTDVPFGSDGVTRWIQLQFPGVETSLTLVNWFPQMPPGSAQGMVLATQDMATTHAELKRRGLAISDIAHQLYGEEATFDDPDGNGWVLLQPS